MNSTHEKVIHKGISRLQFCIAFTITVLLIASMIWLAYHHFPY